MRKRKTRRGEAPGRPTAEPVAGPAMERREFLKAGALVAGALATASLADIPSARGARVRIPQKTLVPEDLVPREDLAG